MISFLISFVVLLLGYLLYSKVVNRILHVDAKRPTPAVEKNDGVDYVPMKPWRIFLIQFLNIAGVGPICGAVLGARYGVSSFIWIALGCVFAGAVHDMVSGFVSLRHDGCSLPEIHGRYLGKNTARGMRIFTSLLLILTVAVFISTPAQLLTTNFTPNWSIYIWVVIIFTYYLIATLLPIDKLIGRIYPIFGLLLLAMAVLILIGLFVHWDTTSVYIPEFWNGLVNEHPLGDKSPIIPMMCLCIACGAISGFHATQSPLMARCMCNENQTRSIFYGSMITEGVVALIWAAAACYFYHDPSVANETIGVAGPGMVSLIANKWFSPVLAGITLLGVISASITTGDTALRSARLIVADCFHISQKPIGNRLLVAVFLSVLSIGVLIYSLLDKEGFATIWSYFGWGNQILATVTLWACCVYLVLNYKNHWITFIPACFMTYITSAFLLVADIEGLGTVIPHWLGYSLAGVITAAIVVSYMVWYRNRIKHKLSITRAQKNK